MTGFVFLRVRAHRLLLAAAVLAVLLTTSVLAALTVAAVGIGAVALDTAPLRADPRSLALPAPGVVALAAAVAAVQACSAGRRGSITELRAGDTR
ncbi:hypothetical protein [Streptomyces sp. NPDC051286]|uniref:hypothetical protein n=1 Tax=Streptomyces sp. NPDC051286 TaxID=3365647 RepID=UPI0037A1E08A